MRHHSLLMHRAFLLKELSKTKVAELEARKSILKRKKATRDG